MSCAAVLLVRLPPRYPRFTRVSGGGYNESQYRESAFHTFKCKWKSIPPRKSTQLHISTTSAVYYFRNYCNLRDNEVTLQASVHSQGRNPNENGLIPQKFEQVS